MLTTTLQLLFVCFCLSSAVPFNPTQCPIALNTTTEYAPVLNDPASTLVANTFTVNWIWSITSTRNIIPSYQFGSCPFGTPNTNVLASSCSFNQSASIDWAFLLANCGWTQLNQGGAGDDIQYGGNLTVNGTETFVDQRGITQTRILSYTFVFAVKFPQSVQVDATIQVFSPILMDTFIITQYYTTSTANGTVDFRTVVEYPWKLTLVNNSVFVKNATSSGTVASVIPYDVNPGVISSTFGTLSNQNFEMLIDPGNDLCVLDDEYTVYATLECIFTDKTLCPTLPTSPDVTITFAIQSESFCPSANNDVQLEGRLRVFDDAAYSNPQTQFVLGTESYFELDVKSSAVTVTDIVIDSVSIKCSTANVLSQPANTQVTSWTIYNAGAWKSNAGLSPVMESPIGPDQKFHFSLNDRLLFIPQDAAFNFTITAKANVTYLGTGVVNKKREALFTFALNTQNQAFGSVFGVTSPQTAAPRLSSDAYSLKPWIGGFQLVIVVLAFLVLF